MLRSFLAGIKAPLETEIFDVFRLNPLPCTDCGYCKKAEKCAYRDLDGLYSSLESCDLLIIASPVYNMSFPSPMKAILDRFQRYYNARFSLGIRPAIKKHRKAVLLICAGSEKETGELMINQLRQSFSVMNTELCASLLINGLDGKSLDEQDDRIAACADVLNNIITTLCQQEHKGNTNASHNCSTL